MRRLFSKNVTLGLLIIFFCLEVNAQRKELLVAPTAQLNNTWCWVASMEMILKFHNPTAGIMYSQPNIFNKYSAMRSGWDVPLTCNDCHGVSYTFNGKNGSKCEDKFSIPISSQGFPLKEDFIDFFFHSFGYQSSQELNLDASPISWVCLKKQIDQCRPFIAFINPTSSAITGNHAIVVKGYLIDGVNNFLIANDPWFRCDTSITTVFPYGNFLNVHGGSRQGTSIEKVLAIVGNIRLDQVNLIENNNCVSCDLVSTAMGQQCFIEVPAPITSTRLSSNRNSGFTGADFTNIQDSYKEEPKGDQLVSKLLDNKDKVVGFNQNILKNELLNYFLTKEKYFSSIVKYISLNKLANCSLFNVPNKILEVLEHEEEVIDVVSGEVDKNIVSTFQRNKEGLWVLRKITNHTSLKSRIDLKSSSSNQPLVLSNLRAKDSIQGSISYELIKFPPFPYEFYSFKSNNESFMSPAENYSDLPFEWGTAYPEKKVIGELRKISKDYLGQYQLELKLDYKQQLSNLIKKGGYSKNLAPPSIK
jgi:hypothetical protein